MGFYRPIKLRFCIGQNVGYFNKANQLYSFFNSVFKKIVSKIDKHLTLSYLLLFNKHLEFDFFFNSIQNSHVHEPSKLVENLQHLHITTFPASRGLSRRITTEKNLRTQCFEIHCLNVLLT